MPGSLGRIPLLAKWSYGNSELKFIAESRLPPNVEYAFHCLAFHENRRLFRPTLFKPNHRTELKEVWFPGTHTDVGGGGKSATGLSNISLLWVIGEMARFIEIPHSHLNYPDLTAFVISDAYGDSRHIFDKRETRQKSGFITENSVLHESLGHMRHSLAINSDLDSRQSSHQPPSYDENEQRRNRRAATEFPTEFNSHHPSGSTSPRRRGNSGPSKYSVFWSSNNYSGILGYLRGSEQESFLGSNSSSKAQSSHTVSDLETDEPSCQPLEPMWISGNMHQSEVVAHLDQHGCQDITALLDLESQNDYPVAQGGLGDVYKAKLRDGSPVAVKTTRVTVDKQDRGVKQLKSHGLGCVSRSDWDGIALDGPWKYASLFVAKPSLGSLLYVLAGNFQTRNQIAGRSTRCDNAVHIPPSRDAALVAAGAVDADVRIYSDGSGIDGGIGAAAVLCRDGQPDRILRLHLGSDKRHVVYEAELVGAMLALHLLASERDVGSAWIGIDNQAVLHTMRSPVINAAPHLVLALADLTKSLTRSHPGLAVTTTWVPAHVGVPGNELADVAAKEAARGLSSDAHDLPAYLRNEIAASPAAAKQAFKEAQKEIWKQRWDGELSNSNASIRAIDESTPSNVFHRLAQTVPRRHASLLIQLRTGHVPLNAYLHRFGLAESASCPACNQRAETVKHFLMNCPAYEQARQRRNLASPASANSLSVLLSSKGATRHLLTFIRETGRFLSTPHA
ncbi:hypothetical protein RhiJN_15119 [Ceratobasidium sp. AG-Ba]|nr:hypothetical protein RhiJN_15119 [Ceratobasidium sp. AG-Ba]